MPSKAATGCSRTSPGRSRWSTFPTEGGPSLTPRVQLKYWPVETNGQPVIWAALELRKSLAAADIKAIEVFTNKFTWFEIGSEPEKWDPQTRETADHSLPYIFARAFVDGPITTRSFTEDKVRDPALRPLMSKIKVTVDDALEAMLPRMVLRVVATTMTARSHSVEIVDPLGHPDNPMQDKDIEEKFQRHGRAGDRGRAHAADALDAGGGCATPATCRPARSEARLICKSVTGGPARMSRALATSCGIASSFSSGKGRSRLLVAHAGDRGRRAGNSARGRHPGAIPARSR